jgi:NAD(P)-dependent dehydrogenase (short-subunit alcohol dehydrogenase family)
MKLQGTGVLITGGSRGLGAALGRELAARGARVVLVARDGRALESVVAGIAARGGEAHAVVADVADKRAVHRVAAVASELAGPIRVLVHNASALGPVPLAALADTACEELAGVLETNLIGPFRLTKALLGSMVVDGEGLVVHITSDAAVEAYPGWGAYGVSKAALEHLGRIWAAELEDSGVRFLTIDPGDMDTGLHAAAIPDADRSTLGQPADVARWIAGVIGRAGARTSGARLTRHAAAEKEEARS